MSLKLMGTVAVMTLGAGAAAAQDMRLGEMEYLNSCASCHGTTGQGDGPLAANLMTQAPSDLTVLQANNGGVFPITAAYSVIAGSPSVGPHGTRDMPVWGNRYRIRASNDPDMSNAEIEAYANLRIIALIEYLSTLQAE